MSSGNSAMPQQPLNCAKVCQPRRKCKAFGGAVARAHLSLNDQGVGALVNLEVIWRQVPKTSGDGLFGYRIAFNDEGMLWISSSERKEFDPAQNMGTNLGKI